MANRKLQFDGGVSQKFWTISLKGTTHTVTFGRIGTTGQTRTKHFDTNDAAKKSYDKLIEQKLGKGYVDTKKKAASPRKRTAKKDSKNATSVAHRTTTVRKPTLIFPPFPDMTWDFYWWSFVEMFPSGVHDGGVEIHLYPDGPIPTDAQISAYKYLKANEAAIAQVVLKALFKEYRRIQPFPDYGDMPKLSKASQLQDLLGLHCVNILPEEERGVAYTSYSFYCEVWDDEHGHGVKLHKRRVVDIGGMADWL